MTSLHRVYQRVSQVQSFLATLRSSFTTLLQDEAGQDLIEYALVASVVGLGGVTALHLLTTKIAAAFNGIASQLTSSY